MSSQNVVRKLVSNATNLALVPMAKEVMSRVTISLLFLILIGTGGDVSIELHTNSLRATNLTLVLVNSLTTYYSIP